MPERGPARFLLPLFSGKLTQPMPRLPRLDHLRAGLKLRLSPGPL